MNEKATVDTLTALIKDMLAVDPENHQGKDALTLWIVPGDEALQRLMLAKEGKFSIIIRELPAELGLDLANPTPSSQEQGRLAGMSFFAPEV